MWNYLGYSAVFSVVTLVLGYWMFKRLEPKFAETI
jgi:ABC-type polysaccharide/polyol phosphate export permease